MKLMKRRLYHPGRWRRKTMRRKEKEENEEVKEGEEEEEGVMIRR